MLRRIYVVRERERGTRSKITEKPYNKKICNFYPSAYVINVTSEGT